MNKSKKPLSTEEKTLFRNATKGVKPLQSKREFIHKAPQQIKHKDISPLEQTQPLSISPNILNHIEPSAWVGSEDCIQFARQGIQHKQLQKLQRGQIPIEAQIDLHGLTIDETIETVQKWISTCIEKKQKCVCIIHGKGFFSNKSQPILKNFLNQWLRNHPTVLAFHSAKPMHGGRGALYVLLKSRK